MKKTRGGLSIATKLYIFIVVTVLAVAVGTAALSFRISADQIDRYYKQLASDTAANFASSLDAEFLGRLREALESDEFQALREAAEEADDERMIQDYLEEHGLWEQFERTRAELNRYLENMQDIKYLYLMACGDEKAMYDMYLMDDYSNPLYAIGYYEVREEAFVGVDMTKPIEPRISTGDWGWLCSAYAPVFDSNHRLIANVGCDFGMDEVMAERNQSLRYMLLAAAGAVLIVLAGAVLLINRIIIRPVNRLTAEMKKFRPFVNASYHEAGVAELDHPGRDEIGDLYRGIHDMQVHIVDYLNDLDTLQKDKERAEETIRSRDEQIGEISREAYRDALTGTGSKAAYVHKAEEISRELAQGRKDFGIVMVDMNHLKKINDEHGHRMGDEYIKGCCHLICEHFKHSPVYRIGGDEFVVLLQGKDFDERHERTSALRRSYREAMAREDAKPWERYSAAVGLAELSHEDRTVDLIFKRADKAMYEDKEAFRRENGTYR
ncbi:MAG: diguanylate cyclase [Clostridia bacterium]|nr:diguanylate cyclase [Clostridia bacterium]